MEELIKRIIYKLFPEMQQGQHLLQYARVEAIPGDVGEGAVSDAFEPRFAVNVQMLDKNGVAYGPVFESVPCPVPTASNNRGLFGFPQPGTVVAVQYAYGDPEMPVIVNVYPFGANLPGLGAQETLLQHSSATFLRSTAGENWDLRARNKLRIGNADVDLVAEVQRLAAILETHTHSGIAPGPSSTAAPVQSGDIGQVATKVNSIKT